MSEDGYKFPATIVLLQAMFEYPSCICMLPFVLMIRWSNQFKSCDMAPLKSPKYLVWTLCVVWLVQNTIALLFVHWRERILWNGLVHFNINMDHSSFIAIQACSNNDHWIENLDCFCNISLDMLYQITQQTIKILAIVGTQTSLHHYEPSLGIRWYLDAQMLPEYKTYFDVLFTVQPVICASLAYHYVAPRHLGAAVS